MQYNISSYFACWSRLCEVSFKDKNYKEEKHTWIEWYERAKLEYKACDANKQRALNPFFVKQLHFACEEARRSIQRIEDQYYMLELNDVLNDNLKKIIEDFKFEFEAALMFLDRIEPEEDIWSDFDALNSDFEQYISNWVDIKHYNYVSFKPSFYLIR